MANTLSNEELQKKAVENAEIQHRKQTLCAHCAYFPNTNMEKTHHAVSCDYLIITGKRRPCKAGECKEAGVFKEKHSVGKRTFRVKRG